MNSGRTRGGEVMKVERSLGNESQRSATVHLPALARRLETREHRIPSMPATKLPAQLRESRDASNDAELQTAQEFVRLADALGKTSLGVLSLSGQTIRLRLQNLVTSLFVHAGQRQYAALSHDIKRNHHMLVKLEHHARQLYVLHYTTSHIMKTGTMVHLAMANSVTVETLLASLENYETDAVRATLYPRSGWVDWALFLSDNLRTRCDAHTCLPVPDKTDASTIFSALGAALVYVVARVWCNHEMEEKFRDVRTLASTLKGEDTPTVSIYSSNLPAVLRATPLGVLAHHLGAVMTNARRGWLNASVLDLSDLPNVSESKASRVEKKTCGGSDAIVVYTRAHAPHLTEDALGLSGESFRAHVTQLRALVKQLHLTDAEKRICARHIEAADFVAEATLTSLAARHFDGSTCEGHLGMFFFYMLAARCGLPAAFSKVSDQLRQTSQDDGRVATLVVAIVYETLHRHCQLSSLSGHLWHDTGIGLLDYALEHTMPVYRELFRYFRALATRDA